MYIEPIALLILVRYTTLLYSLKQVAGLLCWDTPQLMSVQAEVTNHHGQGKHLLTVAV